MCNVDTTLVLDFTYTTWLSQGAVVRLNTSRKVAKNGNSFDGTKIEIPSSGILHLRVPRVPTDLELRLSFSWVSLLKESSGLVAARLHVGQSLQF